jgi:hypothetical protein
MVFVALVAGLRLPVLLLQAGVGVPDDLHVHSVGGNGVSEWGACGGQWRADSPHLGCCPDPGGLRVPFRGHVGTGGVPLHAIRSSS